MTCEELTQLIADLADQISDKESLIVGTTAACLSDDIFIGNKPQPPLTLAAINTRIGELQMLQMLAPQFYAAIAISIASYTAMKQNFDDKAALEMQRQMAIQTKNMQGC